jgi:hypothetical protein
VENYGWNPKKAGGSTSYLLCPTVNRMTNRWADRYIEIRRTADDLKIMESDIQFFLG